MKTTAGSNTLAARAPGVPRAQRGPYAWWLAVAAALAVLALLGRLLLSVILLD